MVLIGSKALVARPNEMQSVWGTFIQRSIKSAGVSDYTQLCQVMYIAKRDSSDRHRPFLLADAPGSPLEIMKSIN